MGERGESSDRGGSCGGPLGERAQPFETPLKDVHLGLYFNGEARDTCWGRGMFRGYVSGYFSGYVSGVCFGYVSRHQELLYLQSRGYVTGCYGVCFAGVQPVCHS